MVFIIFTILIYFAPTLWVKYTLNKHDDELPNMPFNGLQFGNKILKENSITNVSINGVKNSIDYYNPTTKEVVVESERLEKKSLTSITVICHEIGHAIQDSQNYEPLKKRQEVIKKTKWISKIANILMYIGIPTILATQSFPLIRICVIIIFLATVISNFTHIITLNVELDASFNRALPILKKKIPSEYHDSCNSILKVCAFTYVIAAMTSFLNLRYLLGIIRLVILRK